MCQSVTGHSHTVVVKNAHGEKSVFMAFVLKSHSVVAWNEV